MGNTRIRYLEKHGVSAIEIEVEGDPKFVVDKFNELYEKTISGKTFTISDKLYTKGSSLKEKS